MSRGYNAENRPRRLYLSAIGVNSGDGRLFDTKDKQLKYVYCHYLVPESPPDQCWAFDETMQWCAIRARHAKPLDDSFLVLEAADNRTEPH